ncbi:immunoglobulin-like domain-containing protein [Breznakia pachnodae]|uniref:DUF5011 domain-containing protein n=1 Tax=Breznakia pachnodae TaxID=265178 RepID=A0ABU0E891_9FIRM|nr:immunoglobulin-like domain-containing protein [Breznakia pachnodae]MDQ0363100.1 hypothetical protein [Breznakia pachnodae]
MIKRIIQKFQDLTTVYKVITIIVSLSVIAAVTFAVYTAVTPNNKLKLKEESFVFEYGYSYSYEKSYYIDADKEILDKITVKINGEDIDNPATYDLSEEQWLDIYDVGTYKGVATYEDEKVEFLVEIKDTTKPEFISFNKEITVKVNDEKVEFESYFYAGDLSDVTLSVDTSDVDLSKAGSYEITVVAEDEYGNKTEKTATVIVEK